MESDKKWARHFSSKSAMSALLIGIGLLFGLQLALILGSWLWSAAMPESSVRSILSDSGIRWFFGTFVANLANPLLVWIVLLHIAFSACRNSGLFGVSRRLFRRQAAISSRQKTGLRAATGLLCVEGVIIALLTVPRHALLLSVTGRLFPSAMSESIVPMVAFAGLTSAISYGLFSGSLHNYRDVVKCCIIGSGSLSYILAVYVLAVELWYMFLYVFAV